MYMNIDYPTDKDLENLPAVFMTIDTEENSSIFDNFYDDLHMHPFSVVYHIANDYRVLCHSFFFSCKAMIESFLCLYFVNASHSTKGA